jgi:hypothetical protein
MFLPEDCPLVDHIIKSYKKHYIGQNSLLSAIEVPKSVTQAQAQAQQKREATLSPKAIADSAAK